VATSKIIPAATKAKSKAAHLVLDVAVRGFGGQGFLDFGDF